MGQGEARGVRPRTTLSSLAESLNDGRQPDGEVAANLEAEIRKVYEVGGRRFRVALLATEVRRIPAEMRPDLTSAEIAMSGSYFDDVLRDPRRYRIENTTDKVRRRGAVRRELPASLRSAVVRSELPRIRSLSHVFRKLGIHIVTDPVTEVVADGANFIEPGD
jgi:hypothetical protein